jgi:Major capsid protein N-terminus
MPPQKPVGEMKRLVSLVDRGPIDDYLYPRDSKESVIQPTYQQYHNFSSEVLETNYTGNATWGSRISFTVPVSEHADMLQWCALVIKPGTWLPAHIADGLRKDDKHCFLPIDISGSWIYTDQIGAVIIEKAELEVGGITVDTVSGDWATVVSAAALTSEKLLAWKDSIIGSAASTEPFRREMFLSPTEDGYIYCWLPFWFARRKNTAFPLVSMRDQPVRIHVTLRPFLDCVRMWDTPRANPESTPLAQSYQFRDYTFNFPQIETYVNAIAAPTFLDAKMMFGVSYLDDTIRKAYLGPHEVLIEQVTTMNFDEPLKYAMSVPTGNGILVGLPLSALNNPLRRIFFFLRRKAIFRYNEWTNFGSRLEDEVDPVFSPQKPMLRRAKLLVGTVFLADQPERWWRYTGSTELPGAANLYSQYIYSIAFDGDNDVFRPQGGTVNASRVDIRLDLEVEPPSSAPGISTEWEVVVFGVGYNWMRFQNGIANLMYTD